MIVKYKKLVKDAESPLLATGGSTGYDIKFYDKEINVVILEPGDIELLSTGLSLSFPSGLDCQVRSKSGLASMGIMVLNSPGTIDSDYRGEIKVILGNFGKNKVRIDRGNKIAQLVFVRTQHVLLVEKKELEETVRGDGGFGSTGK